MQCTGVIDASIREILNGHMTRCAIKSGRMCTHKSTVVMVKLHFLLMNILTKNVGMIWAGHA